MRLKTFALAVFAATTAFAPAVFGAPAIGEFAVLGTKWEPGPNAASSFPTSSPPGTPGSATFSIMGSGFSDVSGSDAGHSGSGNTQLITNLAVPTWTATDYANVIDWALDQWDAVSGFTNLGVVADGGVNAGASQASGGHLGDVRIAAWEITVPFTLAHAFQPGTEAIFGPGGTIAGDLHFDVNRTWRDDPTDTNADADIDIYTVALHEIGHSLGLDHSTVPGSVMEATYAGARRTLTADDIAGIVAIYGLVPEPGALAVLGIAGALGLLRRRRAS